MFPRQDPEPPIELGLNQPAKPTAAVPAPEELQFRTVEAEDPNARRCRLCGSSIASEYYQVSGADACPACAQRRQAQQANKGKSSDFGRALLFGLGASLAGTALYTIVLLVAHLQLSIIAIVVGVMVGKAVLKGARGCQGKRFQILAVALTYFSITSSFVPLVISEVAKKQPAKTAQSSQPSKPLAR